MRTIVGIALAGAALVGAQPAAAETWRVAVNGGDAPDRVIYLVDTDSISRDGDVVRFRSSTVWESLSGEREFDKSITQRQGVCSSKSGKIIVNNVFVHGTLLRVDDEPGEMITFAPDTLMRGVLDAVCGEADYETDAIDDYEATIRAYFAQNAN